MALSFVDKATGTTSATLPTFANGDLALVFAFRDGSTTPPSIPTGWTQILTRGTTTSCSQAVGWRRLQTGDTSTGTWTNATSVVVHIYRSSTTRACVGGSASNGGTTNTINYPAVTMQRTDSTSWVAGFCGHRSTNQNIEVAPSGMTARSDTADATDEAAGHDTNGAVSAWNSTNFTGTGTASGWQSATIEIVEGIAFRQIVIDNVGTVATNANAFSFPVQKDQIILAAIVWDTQSFTSIADNAAGGSNTYTQIGTEFSLDVGGGAFVFVRRYWAKAKATESLTITSTLAVAPLSGHTLATMAYDGVHITAPVDVQDINGASSTTSETLAVTTTTTEDRVVGINASAAGTPAITTGYTSRGSTTETLVSDKHIDTATTETATFTCASGAMVRTLIALKQFSLGQIVSIAQTTETELAQAIAWSPKNRLVALVTETELAQTLTRAKAHGVTQAAETNVAQAVAWAPKNRFVQQAFEIDSAHPVGIGGAPPPTTGDGGTTIIILRRSRGR